MIRGFLLASVLALAGTGAAMAQTVGLATTKGGATEQIATALASAITKGGVLSVRPQMVANTSQYIPLVNDGRIEFGIANFPQTFHAVRGIGMSEGEPHPDLRMVATIVPFVAGLMVAEKAGIADVAGLRGRRVPRFPANSLGDTIIRASLATAGLGYDDVESVPTANFPAMFKNLMDGVTDVSIATVGSKPTYEIDAAVGGARFLSFAGDAGPKLDALMPGTSLHALSAEPKLPGVAEGTRVFVYDYTLFAHKDVPDAVVGEVARALHTGADALKATGPLFAAYDPTKLAGNLSLDYHPGAVAYYRSVGIWPGN